jgi:hypothetical protein
MTTASRRRGTGCGFTYYCASDEIQKMNIIETGSASTVVVN